VIPQLRYHHGSSCSISKKLLIHLLFVREMVGELQVTLRVTSPHGIITTLQNKSKEEDEGTPVQTEMT